MSEQRLEMLRRREKILGPVHREPEKVVEDTVSDPSESLLSLVLRERETAARNQAEIARLLALVSQNLREVATILTLQSKAKDEESQALVAFLAESEDWMRKN